MTTAPREIRLHIERLVIDSELLDGQSAHRLESALKEHLATLLEHRASQVEPWSDRTRPARVPFPLHVEAPRDAVLLGEHLALCLTANVPMVPASWGPFDHRATQPTDATRPMPHQATAEGVI
jgi:hypothetical protein